MRRPALPSIIQGNVIISEGYDYSRFAGFTADRIQKFDSSGGFISKICGYVSGDIGKVSEPAGISFNGNGNLCVPCGVDVLNPTVNFFNTSADMTGRWTPANDLFNNLIFFDNPFWVSFRFKRELLMTTTSLCGYDIERGLIVKTDSGGNFVKRWGILGAGNGEVNLPTGIMVDSGDNVLFQTQEMQEYRNLTATAISLRFGAACSPMGLSGSQAITAAGSMQAITAV